MTVSEDSMPTSSSGYSLILGLPFVMNKHTLASVLISSIWKLILIHGCFFLAVVMRALRLQF